MLFRSVCPNQEAIISTDSGYVSYYWDFGDGFAAYGTPQVNHTYSSLGNYTVEVTMTNYCGNDTSFTNTVTVDNIAGFPSGMYISANNWNACPGELITFSTQNGFDYYFWDFGDGDTVTTSSPAINHAYQSTGSYDISVTIINGCDNSTTLSLNGFNVSGSAMVNAPWIYTSFNSYCPGDMVMFLISSNMGMGGTENYTYSWDFGDETSDTTIGIGASHSYDSTGSYLVTVTVTNACGNSEIVNVPVNIINNASPTLNEDMFGTFSQTNIVGCPGDAIVFYFEGAGENLWDFGDGSSGIATEELLSDDGITVTVIKHAYGSTGSYVVKLTLTNECGNSVTDSITIQIMNNMLVDGGLVDRKSVV